VELEKRFIEITELMKEYLPFTSQWDAEVIRGKRYNHPWIEQTLKMSSAELADFDAGKNFTILNDKDWLSVISKIELLTSFPEPIHIQVDFEIIGKKKKQHELSRIYSLLHLDKNKTTVDFGGGVGNLAYFLEDNLSMQVKVLEQNQDLITKGIQKFEKHDSKISFHQCKIGKNIKVDELENIELATGLHTCGNFATDMFRSCVQHSVPKIVNFGCCYSKIENDDYNLSSLSDKNIFLNKRALSSATLGFGTVPVDFYTYRIKILEYKFSFYHWLYKTHGIMEFCSMGNTRRSLYQKTFPEFVEISLKKFFPQIPMPPESELNHFLESEKNKEMHHYFAAYYAISRYFGKLTEAYIICDRALYLKEQNYSVEIKQIFDPQLSPRNKAIIATRNS
jgi:hypothetical protein